MKRFFKYILAFNFLLLVFICLPSIVCAQGNPGCDPDNTRCGDPDCTYRVWCPIDNGVILLFGIGALYGIKVVKDQRKRAPSKEL